MAKSVEEIQAELARKRQPKAVSENHASPPEQAPEPRQTPMMQRAQSAQRKSAPRSLVPVKSPTSSSQDVHRSPPHSAEAEQGVLGSMLLSPRDVIAECVERINEEYFYIPAHETVYNVLVDLWNAGQAIDLITFTQVLRDRNLLDAIGGPSFVTSLYTFVPTAANVDYYLGIIRDKYLLRQVIAGGTEAVRRAYEEQDEVSSLIDEVEQAFINIGDSRTVTVVQSMRENVMRAIEQIGDAADRKGGIIGMATGFVELDRMTGGLRASEMIVIAARPSMGKTALAMNIAEYASVTEKRPVGVFSLEMSTDQLVQRLLCSRARVNMQKVRDGFIAERDYTALTAAAAKLSEAPLFIDDTSGMTILELRAKARRFKAQHKVELIIVDYLQLLRAATKRRDDNRQVEVAEISAGLKSLAKELGIPVIVVAQLNRQPEARHGGKPRLSDLRESGSIEQDADLVALLVRREVYEEDEEARQEMAGEAELIIAKQRNGPVGEIPLIFLKEFTRFEDRARMVAQPEEDL
jgi:replicative DNA helicase